MMKTKIAKLILPIVILATVLAATCLIASADEVTPEIVSQNVQYDDKFSLMYAVDASTATAPVTLNLYYADPEGGAEIARTYVATEPQTEKIGGKDTSVFVFVTEGVAAKNFDKSFFVQAVDATGAESSVVKYSVLEYMLVRLYGGQSITEGQKGLYENAIEFASYSQRVLINEKDEDPTNDVTLASDYHLVTFEGGFIGETEGATSGYSQGVYPKGAVIYPTKAGAGSLTAGVTASDGSVSSVTLTSGAALTVSGNTVISAGLPTAGNYYATYGGLDFEGKANIKEFETAGLINRPTYYVKDPSGAFTGTEDYIYLFNDNGNHGMQLASQEATNKPGISVMDTAGSAGNCYVFEAKFKIDMNEQTGATIAALAAPRAYYFYIAKNTLNNGAPNGNENNALLTGSGFAAIYAVVDGEGTVRYYLNHNNSKTANNDIITENNEITAGWHTMTCEIYENGWVKVYLDGQYIAESKCISNNDLNGTNTNGFVYSDTNSVRIKPAGSASQGYANNCSIYLDDVFFGKVVKEYVKN